MPWKEVKPMDEKVLFLADYLRESQTFTDLCCNYGISRKGLPPSIVPFLIRVF